MVALLPNGKQQFIDINGAPLIGGLVYHYIPGTTSPKNTWQDEAQTILNTNPVVLDARGQAVIFGDGQYRQVLKDSDENLIWDQLTTAPVVTPEDVETTLYDLPLYIMDKPVESGTYLIFDVVRSLVLPATILGGQFSTGIPPADGNATFTLYKGNVSIGTVAFTQTTGVPVVTFPSDVNFLAGDRFGVIAPTPQDGNMAFISFTFPFTVL
jgi:hypothetical protein